MNLSQFNVTSRERRKEIEKERKDKYVKNLTNLYYRRRIVFHFANLHSSLTFDNVSGDNIFGDVSAVSHVSSR